MSAADLLPAYAELHCLSNYSFLRGASHPEELVERAAGQRYAALALTDECSLAGAVRAHMAAKDAGLPLILGSEFTLADRTKLVLLAQDRTSYGDLAQLITRGRRSSAKGSYRLTRDDVAALASSCLALWLPQLDPGFATIARGVSDCDAARWVRDIFADRAWIGVELSAEARDRARLAHAQALSKASGLPLVAAGDVHMHVRARRALQDTLTAIRLRTPVAACGRALHPNGERHLRARARLAAVYPSELVAETAVIARRCTFSLDTLRYEYPEEIVPPGETPASWLRTRVEQGLSRRYGGAAPGTPPGVRAQIEHELALIAELRYEPYFLTVDEIVAFAR
ncbi:MAG TPA: PHP domain-containing protein, partial [Casimicrobiaceae bacterium]